MADAKPHGRAAMTQVEVSLSKVFFSNSKIFYYRSTHAGERLSERKARAGF